MIFTEEMPKKRGIYYVRQKKNGKIYMAYMYRKHGIWMAGMGPNLIYAFGLFIEGQKWLRKEVMFFRSENAITQLP